MEDIVLLGIGGHAHSVVDSIEQGRKYHIIGFLDADEMQDKYYRDYRVLGNDSMLQDIYLQGVKNAFITVGYMGQGNIRNRLYQNLKQIGYRIPNIIDNSSVIAQNVKLEEGIYIGKRAVINANSYIRKMCIINTGAIVEHDCVINEYSHIAIGSVLCGSVLVGRNTFIGANSTIIQQIKIGDGVVIGAGALITKNIRDNIIKYGTVEKEV